MSARVDVPGKHPFEEPCCKCGGTVRSVCEPLPVLVGVKTVTVDMQFVRCDHCGFYYFLRGDWPAAKRAARKAAGYSVTGRVAVRRAPRPAPSALDPEHDSGCPAQRDEPCKCGKYAELLDRRAARSGAAAAPSAAVAS